MKFNLTLTRWHKIAERINLALREREANVKAAFTATTISAWNKQGIEDKAAEIARRAQDDLALVDAGVEAIATIRAALAIRNAEVGISARLSEAEAAKRRAALFKAVLDGQKADMVRPDGVSALPAGLPGEPDAYGIVRRSSASLTLQTADGALLDALRAKLASEQARATRLLDEVADLNREKLEIDVGDEVLQVAGLA